MATLVLTAVGTAIGGPLGGALGAVLGNAIDRTVLFKPKGREGPRLTELAVQTSSYGSPIAQLFGTMRVAGTVIWATDLIEARSTTGGGKSGPSTTNFSYSVSLAVLLSARPIQGIGRIWADGKLLRGAEGDLKTETMLRVHPGGEIQVADPLIASAEGAGLAPAHRGCAYAVFEGMALEDYGNRIPSLSFEVIADPGAVTMGAIAAVVTDGLIDGAEVTTTVDGYSAYGATLRDVVSGLVEAGGAWFAEGLVLRARAGAATEIGDDGAAKERGRGLRGVREIAPADTAPSRVSIAHYDAARDYQAGLQRADRPGAGVRHARIELPAVIGPEAAKRLASDMLMRTDVARERRRVALDWRRIDVAPGDRVRIVGEAGLWRVAGWTLEAMVLNLDLVRIARATLVSSGAGAATSGRVIGAPDRVHGPTTVFAFEMPPTDDVLLSAPRLTIAAAGASAGWRSATLSISTDGGARWTSAGPTRGTAVLGQVAVVPGWAPSTLIDRVHAIEVTLANDAMALAEADAGGLDAGANLALVGDELVQFGRAVRIGVARWRLTELWRGRRGTESAAGTQSAGDRFVLIDPASLATIELPLGTLTGTVSVMAAGIGDGSEPPVAVVPVTGASILPPAPVHLRAARAGDGSVTAIWVRRSRVGWRWLDGVDTPLGEEREAYRVMCGRTAIDVANADAVLAAAQVDGVTIAVRQLAAFGLSRAATIAVPV